MNEISLHIAISVLRNASFCLGFRYGILNVMLERHRRLAGPSPARVVGLLWTAWAVERVRRALVLRRRHVQQRHSHVRGSGVWHQLVSFLFV